MILGVIVTFNPNLNELRRNINSIVIQLDKLVIFDNNSSNSQGVDELSRQLKVEVHLNNENVGLGAAYNFVINNSPEAFEYFVTFDQDSFVPIGTIQRLLKLFEIHENVGLVGPRFSNKVRKTKKAYKSVTATIQSCLIIHKDTILNVGLFDESLFIDSVDFDYCLRARINNFLILVCNETIIHHTLGTTKRQLGIKYIEHNSNRNFYIARNHKIVTIKYFKKFPFWIIKKNLFFVVHLLKTALFTRKFSHLKNSFIGLFSSI